MHSVDPKFGCVSPTLPWEILGEIFSHCDQRTLGRVSRVSFDCLALSASLLYEDITLSSERAVASLCRVPYPDNDPADPAAPSFPPSNRITPHTSRSLIHSLTYTGFTPASYSPVHPSEPFAFVAHLLRPPIPLDIDVLVVSLPPDIDEVRLGPFMLLFNPVTVIALGRPSSSDRDWPVLSLGPDIDRPWSRLRTVILSGVGLEHYEQLASAEGSRPLRVIVDLLHPANPDDEVAALSAAMTFAQINADVLYEVHAYDQEPELEEDMDWNLVWAWVANEEMKRVVEREVGEGGMYDVPGALGRNTFVEIVDERVRRFREELMSGGVSRKMDWEVLEGVVRPALNAEERGERMERLDR